MKNKITAVYENGLLRPLEPLALAEKQIVQIEITPQAETVQPPETDDELIQRLIAAGLLTPPPKWGLEEPMPSSEYRPIADEIGRAVAKTGKMVSDIVIEDRGEW